MERLDRYRVIVADPPWKFDDRLTMSDVKRGAESNYPVMDSEVIKGLGLMIKLLAEEDSIMVLWVVSSQLQLGLDVMRAWGFTQKQIVVWNKYTKFGKWHMGMGWTFRCSNEIALVGTRGKMTQHRKLGNVKNRIDSQALAPHTTKPEQLQNMLMEMYPDGPYLELFARRERLGWTCLGGECPGDGHDIRDSLAALIGRLR